MKIPKIILKPHKTEESKKLKFGFEEYENYVGKDFQLGGEPKWIQEEDWPICKNCGEKMTFYAQLDSINDDYRIGDCGLVYVFICFNCLESKSIVQSY